MVPAVAFGKAFAICNISSDSEVSSTDKGKSIVSRLCSHLAALRVRDEPFAAHALDVDNGIWALHVDRSGSVILQLNNFTVSTLGVQGRLRPAEYASLPFRARRGSHCGGQRESCACDER